MCPAGCPPNPLRHPARHWASVKTQACHRLRDSVLFLNATVPLFYKSFSLSQLKLPFAECFGMV
jgi:hypothetical protein